MSEIKGQNYFRKFSHIIAHTTRVWRYQRGNENP